MKVALVGGHLSPALAVIDELDKNSDVIFIGRKHAMEGEDTLSLEYNEISRRGIPFFPLTTARLQRKVTRHTVPALARLPIGLYQAVQYLRAEKPDVVLSFGGYLSLPVGYAAKFLGIPLVIHEQTLHVGLANKLLSKFADRICISWESSLKQLPDKKTIITGNPLKRFSSQRLTLPFDQEDKDLPLIYITGGSTGSHAINSLIVDILPDLVKKYRIFHQVGDARSFNDFDRLSDRKEKLPLKERRRYHHTKFVPPEEIDTLLSESDLVVSRSGMNTVTEILYFGCVALLIPLPYGQKNEQLENAEFVKSIGLGDILLQHNATGEVLLKKIMDILSHREEYKAHAAKARSYIKKDAAAAVISQLFYVVKKKTS